MVGITQTLNRYKRYIIILGFAIGGASTMGLLPAQPISGVPIDTTKIIYTLLIAGCMVVFMKFFKPLRAPIPQAPIRRPVQRIPPVRDNSDVFGDIDNSPPLNVPRPPGRSSVEKQSIYDGFKNSPDGLDLGKP